MKQGDFTDLADDYVKYRPSYNKDLVEIIINHVGKKPKSIKKKKSKYIQKKDKGNTWIKKKKKKKSKKGGGTKHKQNWKKNQGIFGPMMKKNKLVRDEICHNCTISAYEKGARRFCKTHKKVWDRKTNSCRIKKKKKSKNK